MTEQTPETPAEQPGDTPQEGAEQEPKTFDAEYVSDLRKEAAKYRTEAKAAAAELENLRQASLSDQERAVEEARKAGQTEATKQFGARLARTEFDAIAGRRNPDFDTQQALEYVDLAKFIGEDGEPDRDAIKSAVERLVPEPTNGPPSFDGGARSTPKSTDFNQVLRQAAGRA